MDKTLVTAQDAAILGNELNRRPRVDADLSQQIAHEQAKQTPDQNLIAQLQQQQADNASSIAALAGQLVLVHNSGDSAMILHATGWPAFAIELPPASTAQVPPEWWQDFRNGHSDFPALQKGHIHSTAA